MVTEPKVEYRKEQPYVGIRSLVTMETFGGIIPQHMDEVFAWLKERGIAPAGAPIIRYHVIDMAAHMDIEIGVPVATAVTGNGRINVGMLPAGRYASLVYTGDYSGLYEANGVLIQWARDNGISWDVQETERGDAFGSRYESYITDPGEEPDSSKWQTEVAIKLADEPSQ